MVARPALLGLCLRLLLVAAHAQDIDENLKPKTTTQKPPTTTIAPVTTTITPITTTAAPNITTTAVPITTTPELKTTTAAPPTPVPQPPKGKWAYTDSGSNITCVIIQMASQLNVSYYKEPATIEFAVFNIPINETIVVSGSCGKEVQNITLEWPSFRGYNNNVAFFEFLKNGTTSAMYSLTRMRLNITLDSFNFPGSKDKYVVFHHTEKFAVPIHKSYSCSAKQIIHLETDSPLNSTLSVQSLQLEAFHTEKGNSFDSAEECDFVDVPDIVPIAVGCALGGLVLVVLMTYLVGRRRTQTRGYLSM